MYYALKVMNLFDSSLLTINRSLVILSRNSGRLCFAGFHGIHISMDKTDHGSSVLSGTCLVGSL